MTELDSNVPYGYCYCGCGQKTNVARNNCNTYGWTKGQPKRFLTGHNRRLTKGPGRLDNFSVEDRGYETPCWVWLGSKYTNGYAMCHIAGKQQRVHRVYYEAKYGPIPEGLEPDHLCRVHACINPDHIEPVTRAVNTQRGASAKLSMEEAREIRRLRVQGQLTYPEIAKRYGVHPTTIGYIVTNKTWTE